MTINRPRSKRFARLPDWIDILALGAWGILFLRYWLTGKLGLLIHPNYYGLTVAAAVVLLVIAGVRGWQQVRRIRGPRLQHMTFFTPGAMSSVLLGAAILGLVIVPRPFASQTAIQRGLEQNIAVVTRSRPQAFRVNESTESRSLIDWVRALDAYPEPDAYTGQRVNVQGFAVHSSALPDQYLTLTRFVITCCAADVYPVGLPVKLPKSRRAYPVDQWFTVQGKMGTAAFKGKRQLVIEATKLTPIPEPENPYNY
ncbi:MAG: TIGR03943 family protein [Acaryochloridaceae cyanobacterium SU_2_1]|nr:TIGR03943 family protein [Acaryochloridaceae cyanobacterium SU_2_1]